MERRGKFRYNAPEIKKAVSASAESTDKKLSFPKMISGLGLAGFAVLAKTYIPILPFMDVLFITGIGTALAGLGIKLVRIKKGGDFWKHEKSIWDTLTKGK